MLTKQPKETMPEQEWVLCFEGAAIYKGTKLTVSNGDVYYRSDCGQPVCNEPDPEFWCEIPKEWE